jgi:protein O-mannosyl-transferase
MLPGLQDFITLKRPISRAIPVKSRSWTSEVAFINLWANIVKELPEESISFSLPRRADRACGRIASGALVIFALVLAAYSPILPGSFLMDDWRMVNADNPIVNGEFGPSTIWFQKEWPLSWFVFWAQWLAWGPHPGCYHAVNMFLHAVSAVLVWRVLTGLKIPGAWVAAAIFAVHPVCVNSVARIAEMKNTLSLPFFLLSLWLYLPNVNPVSDPNPKRRNLAALRYGLSLAAFVLALLSKTSTIMLPPVLLACVVWQRGRITRRDLMRASPFFVLALAFGLLSSWFQKHQQLVGLTLQPETFWERLAMAGRVFWFYFGNALLPVNLNLVYPQWKVDATRLVAYVPDLLVCAAVFVCWRFRCGWGRHILFGLGIFAITLFPVLGFFDSQFLTKWRVSDHLQYLPIIAPITLAVATMAFLLPVVAFRGVAVALVLALSILTFQRAQVFSSEESLFRDSLKKNPAAWGMHNDLGVILAARHDYAAATDEFSAALHYNPGYADAESNLGRVLFIQEKLEESEPHFLAALKGEPNNPETHRRFAALLRRQGRMREALHHLRMAVIFSPKPDFTMLLDYANLLHQTGDMRGAVAQYRKALLLEPDSVEALNNLAWLLATSSDDTLRNGAEAVRCAERASHLPPVKEMCVPGTLAAAYAEAGRFPEAIATAEKALQEETDSGETRFANINRQLLRLYRAGKPFHEQPSNDGQP